MREKFSGLSAKLIASVLLLSVLLCAAISFMGYQQFTTVLEDEYNRSAYEIAETAKSYLNPDRLQYYLETGQRDAEYDEIQAELDQLVISTNTYLIYVTSLSNNYTTSTYIFDSVHPDTGFSRYELGYTAQDMDPKYQPEVEQIMTTGERSAVYFYSYSEASGAHTTAGIPIKDSTGKVVAFLGVEKAMAALEAARSTYVRNVLEITLLAVALFLILYIGFLRRQVVAPIQAITREAQRFAQDNVAQLDVLERIHKRDEIGILARVIGKMETDIVRYVENLTTVTAEKERIGAELNVATQIQADMLPRIFPPFPEQEQFDIYATMTPAREVGGDFYDFFLVDPDHLAVVIADVSGKGVPAALFMVVAKTLIKNHAQAGEEPGRVFELVNNQLCENNEAGMFVTAFLGVLEISTGKFTYVSAGHNPPLVSSGNTGYDWLSGKRNFVLAGMENMRYQQQQITLNPGDSLLLYTDGVTEALDKDGNLYSEDRLYAFWNRMNRKGKDLREQLQLLHEDINTFAAGAEQADDITMLLLQINGKERGEKDGADHNSGSVG